MSDRFGALAESAERASTRGWFVLAFNTGIAALFLWIGVDVANIFISIVTADLVLLIGIAARRRDLALHAKLDELILATGGARDEMARAEERSAREIEELRR